MKYPLDPPDGIHWPPSCCPMLCISGTGTPWTLRPNGCDQAYLSLAPPLWSASWRNWEDLCTQRRRNVRCQRSWWKVLNQIGEWCIGTRLVCGIVYHPPNKITFHCLRSALKVGEVVNFIFSYLQCKTLLKIWWGQYYSRKNIKNYLWPQ